MLWTGRSNLLNFLSIGLSCCYIGERQKWVPTFQIFQAFSFCFLANNGCSSFSTSFFFFRDTYHDFDRMLGTMCDMKKAAISRISYLGHHPYLYRLFLWTVGTPFYSEFASRSFTFYWLWMSRSIFCEHFSDAFSILGPIWGKNKFSSLILISNMYISDFCLNFWLVFNIDSPPKYPSNKLLVQRPLWCEWIMLAGGIAVWTWTLLKVT